MPSAKNLVLTRNLGAKEVFPRQDQQEELQLQLQQLALA
jgi:hypothetical protein